MSSFSLLKASSCAFPHRNFSSFRHSTHKGSALVAKSGISLELNPTRPRKLLTSESDDGRVASFTAHTFSSLGPMPCFKRRIPMKTTLPIPKVHFSPFKVFSYSLANSLCKLWSCSQLSFYELSNHQRCLQLPQCLL